MKAISVRQPSATLIGIGAQKFITKEWRFKPIDDDLLAIVASSVVIPSEQSENIYLSFQQWMRSRQHIVTPQDFLAAINNFMPHLIDETFFIGRAGADNRYFTRIIAVAQGIEPMSSVVAQKHPDFTNLELKVCDYKLNPYAIYLKKVWLLPEQIKVKSRGCRGYFDIDDKTTEKVKEQLSCKAQILNSLCGIA